MMTARTFALLLALTLAPASASATTPVPGRWLGERLTEMAPWLALELLGNPLWSYGFALLTLLLVVLLRQPLMGVLIHLLRQITSRTRTKVDDQLVDALNPPLGIFIGFAGLFLASRWLEVSHEINLVLWQFLRLVVIISVGMALMRSVRIFTDMFARLAKRTISEIDDHLVPLIGRLVRGVLGLMIVVLVVQEFGFNVTGLLTGLGVGGLAFALAAKDTLANWFGALMIYTDRPFAVGDWIRTPDLEGVVEEIGLRSTLVRTFSKTIISVPNQILAGAVIENFSRMPTRRVYFTLRVTYATTPAMMREAVAQIEDIIRTHPEVDQSFWMVKFTDFGESSLDIMLYYFTTTTDWARYLEIRGEVNLMIMDRMAALGVQIALPGRLVHVERAAPEELARLDARAREAFSQRVKVVDAHRPSMAPADGAP